MKTYTIIATIVAIIALGLAGFFAWRYQSRVMGLTGERDDLQNELANTKSALADTEKKLEATRVLVTALDASVSSFVPDGATKVGTFDAGKVTLARQKMGDVVDVKDKEMLLTEWDRFHGSSRLNDFQSVLRKFSELFIRSFSQPAISR